MLFRSVPLRLRCVWTAAQASSHRGGDVQKEQEQEDVQERDLAPLSLEKMQGFKIFCSNSHDLILRIYILCQKPECMEWWSGEKYLAELPVLRRKASEELAAFICLQTHQQCPQSHISALDDFFFDNKLEGERISTFRPTRILISYYLTSASLYNEENKLQ